MSRTRNLPIPKSLLAQVPTWLSVLLSKEVLEFVVHIWKVVEPPLTRVLGSVAVYEVLDYRATIELRDTAGHAAVYTKRERVRFLRNHVSTLQDYGWGDGEPFASHSFWPGRIVERRHVGPRCRTLIALPTPKSRGYLLTFRVRRLIKEGFTRAKECWLEAEVYHKIHRLALRVVFPKQRPPRRAFFFAHHAATMVPVELGWGRDGRPEVTHAVRRPPVGERYTLQWEW